MKICVGARSSLLSQKQVEEVLEQLRFFSPDVEFDLLLVKTYGDYRQDLSLYPMDRTDFFTKEIDQLLRVQARLEGEPAAGAVVKEPKVSPDMALVRGPESLIDELGALSTTPIDLTGHALDFEAQAAVVAPDPLITVLQPRVVTVRIPLEIPGTGDDDDTAGSQ